MKQYCNTDYQWIDQQIISPPIIIRVRCKSTDTLKCRIGQYEIQNPKTTEVNVLIKDINNEYIKEYARQLLNEFF